MRMYDLRIFIQILFNVIDDIFVSRRYLSPFTTAKVFRKKKFDSRSSSTSSNQSHRFRESFLHCFLIIQFVANHAGHSVQASKSLRIRHTCNNWVSSPSFELWLAQDEDARTPILEAMCSKVRKRNSRKCF